MSKTVNIHTPFPTFVATAIYPEHERLNAELKKKIYAKRELDPKGLYRSNAAGTWHSDDHILEWSGDPGKELQKVFYTAFAGIADQHGGQPGGTYNMRLSAWAMVYGDRGYATVHTHPNCQFSAVYYVDTGPEVDEITMATGVRIRPGDLEFVDTRGSYGHQIKGLYLQPSFRIRPEPGLVVAFPSWMPHFVHPVRGDGDRISIAANANVQYKPPTNGENNGS